MKLTGLLLSALALGLILPGRPLLADHVPSKQARSAAAAARVESRLVELGAARPDACAQVASLTAEEIAYFSSDPARIQVVAGLTSEEWLLGGGFLGIMLLATAGLAMNAKSGSESGPNP